jgi:twitching motility protein PilT
MFIGSMSTSTLIDVFDIGVKAVLREMGQPTKLVMHAGECRMIIRSEDMTSKVEKMVIVFPLKEDSTEDMIKEDLQATRVGGLVVIEGNTCRVQLPPFKLTQTPQLQPVHHVVEKHCSISLRSKTWTLDVDEFKQADFNINMMVEMLNDMDGSDLHLRAGNRPYVRVDGDLKPMDLPIISAQDMRDIVLALGGEQELQILETEKESSFQYHSAGIGYLRVSGYIKTGAMALAIRLIPEEPIPFEKLDLPDSVREITKAKRGLFLVCGITGSGKSTTLAAMVDEINSTRQTHIITTEDPIEFVYYDKKSIVSQRMVGRDTYSFANALRGALREDPDVILVGEMRDLDTIRAGLSAAETGHLVLSTLHTTTAVDTVNRMISYFPQNERDLIRQEIAYTLQMVCCQRLLKRVGGGRIPCCEVLIGGVPIVRDAIIDGDLEKLTGIMENDSIMMSFDQHAVMMYKDGIVTREEAISACRDAEGFTRVLTGIKSSSGKILG